MNPRHAAALALVGWYLMVPPAERGGKQLDYHAPLSTWSIMQSFDTAQSCEAFVQKSLKERTTNQKVQKAKP